LQWYNIPEKPDSIEGAESVSPPASGLEYNVTPVWNATNYRWGLAAGVSGLSDSASIILDFSESFVGGEISVKAVNDGFGESEPTTLTISGKSTFSIEEKVGLNFEFSQNQNYIQIRFSSNEIQPAQFRIFDINGRVVFEERLQLEAGFNTKLISKNKLWNGIFIAELKTDNRRASQKILFY
jgi:hypothetical protein